TSIDRRQSSVMPHARHSALQFASRRELEKDVVGVHDRDYEARPTVAKAAFQNVVLQEGNRRANEKIDDTRTQAARLHLSGGESGVAIHSDQMLGEIAIRVMLQLALQI